VRWKRILVIDDDETIRRTTVMALEKEGYRVDTAENGTMATEKAQANFYNLALIDIRLPDMEGTGLLTALKKTTDEFRGSIQSSGENHGGSNPAACILR
jgi:DNA-binding response OmpR family regulator